MYTRKNKYSSSTSDDCTSSCDTSSSSNDSSSSDDVILLKNDFDDELAFQTNFLKDLLITMGEKNGTIDKIIKTYESVTSKKNSIWNLLFLEFYGALSYANDGCVIDFRNNTVIGIFGNNCSGKTSIIDVIQFVLFGETNRFGSESQIKSLVNAITKKCYCKALVSNNNKGYVFEINCSVDKNNKFHFKRSVSSCKLDSSNNIIQNTLKDEPNLDVNDLFGSFDLFNSIHSMQNGYFPSSVIPFMSLPSETCHNIFRILLHNDSLIKCLFYLMNNDTLDNNLKKIFSVLYRKSISEETTILNYLIPKIVNHTNKIIKDIYDFEVRAYYSKTEYVFFQEYHKKFDRCLQLTGFKRNIFNVSLSMCFHKLFYGDKCGLFICDEFIDYPTEEKLVIFTKILNNLRNHYNNIIVMSVHDKAINKLCDNMFTINTKNGSSSLSVL